MVMKVPKSISVLANGTGILPAPVSSTLSGAARVNAQKNEKPIMPSIEKRMVSEISRCRSM